MVALNTAINTVKTPTPAERFPVGQGYHETLVREFQRLYDYEGRGGDLNHHLTLKLEPLTATLRRLSVVPDATLAAPRV